MPRTGGVYSPPAGTKGVSNTTIQSVPYNAFVDDLTADANDARPVTAGGTGATTASGARTNLGLAIGSNVQAYDADLAAIAALTSAADKLPYATGAATWNLTTLTTFGRSLIDDADASTALSTLGVSTFVKTILDDATAGAVLTTLGISAFAQTLLDDADAATARATLGLVIGTNVQAYDAELAAIAALAVTDGNFIVGNGTTWVVESGATARTSLGLGSIATQASSAVAITGGSVTGITDLAVADGGTGASTASAARTNLGVAIGSDVQAYDVGLAAIAALAVTDGNFIVGNGTTWVAESGATVRTSLGLGSIAVQNTINNSDWSGTDLAVANGGTGASDAATARTNLGLGGLAVMDVSDLFYTGSSAANTSFPVGQPLLVHDGTITADRNESLAVKLFSSNSFQFVSTQGTGSALSGTWRSRGASSDHALLVVQRTA
ncbi:hypothetical protein [Sinorhizobium fredii]|uniref:hypothetical protein n=1 Tax=Rhizobium fredii TaxID=380 RepID=UPI00351260B4